MTLSAVDVALIQNRYPEVFRRRLLVRFAPLIGAGTVVLYFCYVWAFFSMNDVLERAKWDIAGNYLADWISYESRPDIEFGDNYLDIVFPRYDALGLDPHPDWIAEQREMIEKRIMVTETTVETGGETSNSGFLGGLPEDSEAEKSNASGFMGAGGTVGTTATEASGNTFEVLHVEAVVAARVTVGDAVFEIDPSQVVVTRGDAVIRLDVSDRTNVIADATLPDWMTANKNGSRIIAFLGFAGRVEIENDEVKVRHRFLGWENFLFDANSMFWGRPLGEVASLVIFGPDLQPGVSNAALAWNNIQYNAEWQHKDVWIKMLQTIVMAFVGTLFASLLAFPLSFLAARNITPNRAGNWLLKRLFDFTRSVDMLIWALFFTRGFGPGPLAGISAIFVTDTGTFGKLYSEALENIDDKQREGVRSVGANHVLVQRFGVLPQVLPVFLSQSLYFWESNTRSATIIGAVGAGGIGLKLWEAMRTNSDWENVAYMVLLILVVVFLFDNVSGFLRSRLIGKAP